MIDYISGKIVEKSPERVVLEVAGVGLLVQISFTTYQQLGEVGSSVKLLTHLHFREPSFELFGFATSAERDMFRLLIQVSGVGVKVARTILSGIEPRDVRRAILEGDIPRLASAPGIGPKTAERIVVFLRDKAARMAIAAEPGAPPARGIERDAVAALESLGIQPNTARAVIRKLIKQKGPSIQLDELVKEALKALF